LTAFPALPKEDHPGRAIIEGTRWRPAGGAFDEVDDVPRQSVCRVVTCGKNVKYGKGLIVCRGLRQGPDGLLPRLPRSVVLDILVWQLASLYEPPDLFAHSDMMPVLGDG
jgi:hypothetical protein